MMPGGGGGGQSFQGSSGVSSADETQQSVSVFAGGFSVPAPPPHPFMAGAPGNGIIPADTTGRLLFGSVALLVVGGILYAVKGAK